MCVDGCDFIGCVTLDFRLHGMCDFRLQTSWDV